MPRAETKGNAQRPVSLGMLRFHDDKNDHENENEILLSFSLRFCTQR